MMVAQPAFALGRPLVDVPFDGTFDSWRRVARLRLCRGVHPNDASWQATTDTQPLLPVGDGDVLLGAPAQPRGNLAVPRKFLRLAVRVSCHRSPARWDALYRVLWRLTGAEPHLLHVVIDPDVFRLLMMERAVRRAAHKMKAFVRFRAVQDAGEPEPRYVAWFEPVHHVVERTAPFFQRRFPSMRWSILTPDVCAHWDRAALYFTPGVTRDAAPSDDDLEELWRAYYAHVFNPARLNLGAMRAEMPKQYWRNLPEARLIGELSRDAPGRTRDMIAQILDAPESIPAELERDHTLRPAPVRPRNPLELPSPRDPEHDPGTRVACERADAVPRRFPAGIATGDGKRVLTGVAGWTDPSLLEGEVFYPTGADNPEARLRYYATQFSLVEVDSTYYALPTRGMAVAWASRTPAHFVFDIKAHAMMTGHGTDARRLPDWARRALPRAAGDSTRLYPRDVPSELVDEIWRRFLHTLSPLRDAGKLGAILLQFPPWFRPTRAAARTLEDARRKLGDDVGAVELRNREWFDGRVAERTFALLRDLDLAYVVVDGPQGMRSSVPPIVEVTSPRLAVFRFHGRRVETWEKRNNPVTERYRYLYDREQLTFWAEQIARVATTHRNVHVVTNNNHANYATTNAAEIGEMIDGECRECCVLRAAC